MRVWRVGHSTARLNDFPAGPYRDKWTWADEDTQDLLRPMGFTHSNEEWDTHLAPWSDPLLRSVGTHEVCGFDSEYALRAWFHGFDDVLYATDFAIWVYDVPEDDVRQGQNGQLLFNRHSAVMQTTYQYS